MERTFRHFFALFFLIKLYHIWLAKKKEFLAGACPQQKSHTLLEQMCSGYPLHITKKIFEMYVGKKLARKGLRFLD